ncbi:MAG: PDDEXK nuclease domain-containing protein [Propionibacteriaceae bacterium]|jgi:predicted nuclease of restriction endonuclease-like (RecB) superfamily|nr:PDDEXK nuclease domain-containing protein [Propionibacteriaceae bacterium]
MLMNEPEYLDVVTQVKQQIDEARHRAMLSVNREMVLLYWNIGKVIDAHAEWGNKFITNLSRDLRHAYPSVRGFSTRNLKYMLSFARAYPDLEFVQTVSAQISWSNNTLLLTKVKDTVARRWYTDQAAAEGWSYTRLDDSIERHTYERQAIASKTSNFEDRLPEPQAALVERAMKDPYIFDFIEARDDMVEREIEDGLISNVAKLLLELGSGFAFVGNQYHLEVEGEDFYIDLLFYHLQLRCYVVVELKNTKFKPGYAGQINFYVSAVDDMVATDQDNPTIGILLCRDKRGLIAEYALSGIDKPIGVSEFKLLETLPEPYASVLPTAEDIEKRIGLSLDDSDSDDDSEADD